MEETLDPIKRKYKYAADYALILGGYIAFFYLLGILFPKSNVVVSLNMVGLLATPVICYQLAKIYRDKACGGYLRFGQAWTFGYLLFFFTSLIMSVLYYVHYKFIQPDFLILTFKQSIELMQQLNYPTEAVDRFIEFGPFNAIQQVLVNIVGYMVGGSILFLIISPMVTRKNDNLPPTDQQYKPYQDNKDSDQEPKA